MKNVLTKVIATVFVFYISIVSLSADEWIEKTVADKEFNIEKGAELVIDHKFGEVKCENWDKSAISVMVVVRALTDDSKKAQKIFDNTEVDLKGNSSKVEVSCELDQRYRNGKDIKVSIDFYIKMPSWIELNMETNYSSAYIETVDGNTNISCGYGNIEIISVNSVNNEVEIKFGNGEIGYIESGDIEISYSKFELKGTNNLTIESEYSDVQVDKSKELSIEIEGGNLEIGSVSSIQLESKFTNVEISNLVSSLFAETEYCNLTVGKISPDFSTINIENEYGAVNLGVGDGASYGLKATAHYGHIEYPEDRADISFRSQEVDELKIIGVVGNNNNPTSNIELHTNYGSINIK